MSEKMNRILGPLRTALGLLQGYQDVLTEVYEEMDRIYKEEHPEEFEPPKIPTPPPWMWDDPKPEWDIYTPPREILHTDAPDGSNLSQFKTKTVWYVAWDEGWLVVVVDELGHKTRTYFQNNASSTRLMWALFTDLQQDGYTFQGRLDIAHSFK